MEDKRYRILIKAIKSSVVLDDYFQTYLVNYVNGIRSGMLYNDFYDFEFLNAIILEFCNNEITLEEGETFESKFESIIRNIRFILPDGIETENYEEIKQSIIMGRGVNDYEFYSIFDDRHDYFQIVNIINSSLLHEYKDNIRNFAIEISPYSTSSSLKREIIAYMNGIKTYAGDINEYTKSKIMEIKKKNGIYPIDEATLASISQIAEEAQSLIKRLEVMKSKIESYEERATLATTNGKNEIDKKAKNATRELQEGIDGALESLQKQLDEYLLMLQKDLKISSDEIFNSILKDTQDKVRNIKLYAEGLSGQTTTELLRIQRVAEEKVSELKNYVQNDSELRKMISEAASSEAVKQSIIDGNFKIGSSSQTNVVAAPSIVVPNNDIGPSIKVPLDAVDRSILPAFDESIPFKERLEKILESKEKREKNGELFHEKTEEVIKDVMEGDWVYLWGPSGAGKSYLADQVSSLIGIELLENRKITDEYTIMAYNDPYGRFRPTLAFEAVLYGKLLLNEEMDSDDPQYQVVLNKLYSGYLKTMEHLEEPKYISFGERMSVPVHPNFRLISTGNTKGLGANRAYSVRDKMDESVQERMVIKKIDYDNRVEERIFGNYKDWYNVFVNMRNACTQYSKEKGISEIEGMITTRDAEAIVRYINHSSKSVDQIIREKFTQNKDIVYLRSLSNYFKQIYDINNSGEIILSDDLANIDEKTLVKNLIYRCNNPE